MLVSKEPHDAIPPASKPTFLKIINTKVILVVILLILVAAPGTYFYLQYQKTQGLLNNPGEASKEEIKILLDKLSKLMVLPDEAPTVATVSDKTKLSDQAFFAKAENGDKVIIYSHSNKAILYRPDLNRIIDVASVNINGPDVAGTSTEQPTSSSSASPVPAPVTVAVFNSTKVSGLASRAQTLLTGKLQGYMVATKGNAKGEYPKTFVVYLNKDKKAKADEVAKIFNGTVTATMPSGEEKPATDLLVVLGQDASSL